MANVRNVQSNRESIDMSRPRRLLSTSKMLIFVEIAENSLEDGTSNIMATVIVYDNGSVEITNKRSFLVDRNDVFKIYFIGTKRVVWFYRRNRVKKVYESQVTFIEIKRAKIPNSFLSTDYHDVINTPCLLWNLVVVSGAVSRHYGLWTPFQPVI